MSSRRVHHPSSSTSLVVRLALVAVACVAGFAPLTHLVSASVAPIVHEDGMAKRSTTASVAPVRRRARLVPPRRRPLGRTHAQASVGSLGRAAPMAAAPHITILRL